MRSRDKQARWVPGMPYAAGRARKSKYASVAAGSVSLDDTRAIHRKLGGQGARGVTEFHRKEYWKKESGPQGRGCRRCIRMNDADAKAIIAYLKSLPVQKH